MNINKYKFLVRVKALNTNLLIIVAIIFLPLKVRAEASNPNSILNETEPGWSLWQKKDEAKNVNFDSGLSNLVLGFHSAFKRQFTEFAVG